MPTTNEISSKRQISDVQKQQCQDNAKRIKIESPKEMSTKDNEIIAPNDNSTLVTSDNEIKDENSPQNHEEKVKIDSKQPPSSGFGSFASMSNRVTFATVASNGEGFSSFSSSKTNGFGETSGTFGNSVDAVNQKLSLDRQNASESVRVDVSISNGEEDEKVAYQTRIKLYKYRQNTWSERGVGPLRLLEDVNDSKKCRIVMRRESVANGHGTKLLLNVAITPQTTVKRLGEKSVTVGVLEKSEDEKDFVSALYCFKAENEDKAIETFEIISSRIDYAVHELDEKNS